MSESIEPWKSVAYLGSAYNPFADRHAGDVDKLESAQANGQLDPLMLHNTAKAWSQTLKEGLAELNMHKSDPAYDANTISELTKDLTKALTTLQRIAPSSSANSRTASKLSAAAAPSLKSLKSLGSRLTIPFRSKPAPVAFYPTAPIKPVTNQICDDYDHTTCSSNQTLINAQLSNEFYDINAIIEAYTNTTVSINDLRCCLRNVFIPEDTTAPPKTVQNVLSQIGQVDQIGLYYNTRLEFVLKYLPDAFRRQIETIHLTPRELDSSMFIAWEYFKLFPAHKHVVGVYTSDFSYMFKYILTASDIWVPNYRLSPYFDNNQSRTLQFTDMPNIVHIKLSQVLADEPNVASATAANALAFSDAISYNVYISHTPKLISFDNITDLFFDTIRIHHAPSCKSIQNKLYANNIDLRHIPSVHGLNILVDETFTLMYAQSLKSLNIKLNKPGALLKIIGVPRLETLVIKGQLSLGIPGQKHVVFDSSMSNLRTFIVEGQITAPSQRMVDNLVYEIVRCNPHLTHVSIAGHSFTGKDIYSRYRASVDNLKNIPGPSSITAPPRQTIMPQQPEYEPDEFQSEPYEESEPLVPPPRQATPLEPVKPWASVPATPAATVAVPTAATVPVQRRRAKTYA